ncbi:membrane protein [Mycoplasma putrefaciens]|uniref:Uncharacterized protein n=1 Tax=Mycoplasma putrefaciens (strain ATCC 15718 / NCTC 10155 / C30 KS-1 / KS-1) TaxID=743965 RepID=A0A7U3ZRZ0_MYCPK|nr:uncharacterized protein MPUT_0023 [Mycoplasma putrefaciens KS1]
MITRKRMNILNWFSLLKDLKYIITTAIITALLVTIAITTSMIEIGIAKFQIADGLFLSLTFFINGPMMAISGILYSTIFDLVSGGAIFIPASIVIHLLMFIVIKLLNKKINFILTILTAELMIFLYVLYGFLLTWGSQDLLTAKSEATKELIVDLIQYSISVASAIVLYISFSNKNVVKIFDKVNPNNQVNDLKTKL